MCTEKNRQRESSSFSTQPRIMLLPHREVRRAGASSLFRFVGDADAWLPASAAALKSLKRSPVRMLRIVAGPATANANRSRKRSSLERARMANCGPIKKPHMLKDKPYRNIPFALNPLFRCRHASQKCVCADRRSYQNVSRETLLSDSAPKSDKQPASPPQALAAPTVEKQPLGKLRSYRY
jgi:hypothetical protein